jgi:hypothetical protein
MAYRELSGNALSRVLVSALVLPPASFAQRSAPGYGASVEDQQIGTILSVRKVAVGYHLVTRYPQIRNYRLYLTVRVSEQNYCGEYVTPVIEEMDDLFAAKGKDVSVVLNGKRLTVKTPTGRKLKAWLSEPGQC